MSEMPTGPFNTWDAYQAAWAQYKADLDPTTLRHAYYSGPGRSGTCVCGHSWQDHHLGCVVRPGASYVQSGGVVWEEAYVPQECEAYGCNEDGGLDAEGNDHCHGYRDDRLPDEHN